MPAWEYCCLTRTPLGGDLTLDLTGATKPKHVKNKDLDQEIHKLGLEGWEMAGVIPIGSTTWSIYFKRPRV